MVMSRPRRMALSVCACARVCVCVLCLHMSCAWVCAVKVYSEASDLFMHCRAIVNFSTSAPWANLHQCRFLLLCTRACNACKSVLLCVSYNCQSENLFSCCLSSFTASLSLSSHHFISFSLSPLFFLPKSLLAQEPHLFMLLGLRCHFQRVAKNSFLKINRVDKLKKIN